AFINKFLNDQTIVLLLPGINGHPVIAVICTRKQAPDEWNPGNVLVFFNQQEFLMITWFLSSYFQHHTVCIRTVIRRQLIGENRHEHSYYDDDHPEDSTPVFFQPAPGIGLYGKIFFQWIISLYGFSIRIYQNYQNCLQSQYTGYERA